MEIRDKVVGVIPCIMLDIYTLKMEISRHNAEIKRNRYHWQDKPVLQKVYNDFYTLISGYLSGLPEGLIMEIGSGTGNIKNVIPECILSDLFSNPWIDIVENAYFLSFADNTLSDLILFDVFHHLRFPGYAFREFHRVLKERGRLIILDPCLGWLGYIVYNFLHAEPLGLEKAICMEPPPNWKFERTDYFAAQAQATRIFLRDEHQDMLTGWRMVTLQRLSAISYIASGGYSGPQLYPGFFYPFFRLIDRVCDLFPALFATRLLVVLEKT